MNYLKPTIFSKFRIFYLMLSSILAISLSIIVHHLFFHEVFIAAEPAILSGAIALLVLIVLIIPTFPYLFPILLRESAKASHALSDVPEPAIVIDKNGRISAANTKFLNLLDINNFSELLTPSVTSCFRLSVVSDSKPDLLLKSFRSKKFEVFPTFNFYTRSGSLRKCSCFSYLRDSAPAECILVFFNASVFDAPQLLSTEPVDSLTGFLTRIASKQQIDHQLGHAVSEATMLILDIDSFHNINDAFGQRAGDSALQTIATKLKSALRETDIIARYSGDAFAIFFPGKVESQRVDGLIQKFSDLLKTPTRINNKTVYFRANYGVAFFPKHGSTCEELYNSADSALQYAKSVSRGSFQIFSPDLRQLTDRNFVIRSDLANVTKTDQLQLYFQPQVDSITERPVSAEALLRWKHPTLGFVPPSTFIPVAEETGDILEVSRWVFRRACEQLLDWEKKGIHLPIAVNVSASQLHDGEFLDFMSELIDEFNIDPEMMELELTEGLFIENSQEVRDCLHQLSALGFSLSIDDFGTGYSSFSYLQNFPISKLKIDRTFTRDLMTCRVASVITEMSLTLAKSLDLKTTAEGVETKEQANALKLLGCQSFQGYLYSKPVPVEDLEKYLKLFNL